MSFSIISLSKLLRSIAGNPWEKLSIQFNSQVLLAWKLPKTMLPRHQNTIGPNIWTVHNNSNIDSFTSPPTDRHSLVKTVHKQNQSLWQGLACLALWSPNFIIKNSALEHFLYLSIKQSLSVSSTWAGEFQMYEAALVQAKLTGHIWYMKKVFVPVDVKKRFELSSCGV